MMLSEEDNNRFSTRPDDYYRDKMSEFVHPRFW